ncbi:MAG: hypothetical protein ABFD50_22405 [Smithella sp.]
MKTKKSAILLASGRSLRMEKSKQLLGFDNRPAFARCLERSTRESKILSWLLIPRAVKLEEY